MRVCPVDFDELTKFIGALQAHFHGRHSDVEIEPSLAKAVLIAIDRVLTFANLPYEGYFRNSLSISPKENLLDAVRALIRTATKPISATVMDFRLRGLLEVMAAVNEMPAGELRSIAAMLQPVIDRYNKDLLCDLFIAE